MAKADTSLFRQFLNTLGSIRGASFPTVNPSNPLDATALGSGVIGAVLATILLGVQRVIAALVAAPTNILRGIREFLTGQPDALTLGGAVGGGLFFRVSRGFVAALQAAYATAFAPFGPFAFPVAVGSVLASLYVAGRVRAYLMEVVL